MCHLYVLCLSVCAFSLLPYFLNSLEPDFVSTFPLKQFLSVFHWPDVAVPNGHILVCLGELSVAFEITKCSLPLEISSSLGSTHISLDALSQWSLFYLISLPLKLEHFKTILCSILTDLHILSWTPKHVLISRFQQFNICCLKCNSCKNPQCLLFVSFCSLLQYHLFTFIPPRNATGH